MKKMLFTLIFGLTLFLSACSDVPSNNEDDTKLPDESETLQLTLEELAMYDGKEGNDAYIAVDGVIYDVTGVSAWTNGTHNGNMAGTDVTDAIDSAPHGDSVLDGLEVVGEIIE